MYSNTQKPKNDQKKKKPTLTCLVMSACQRGHAFIQVSRLSTYNLLYILPSSFLHSSLHNRSTSSSHNPAVPANNSRNSLSLLIFPSCSSSKEDSESRTSNELREGKGSSSLETKPARLTACSASARRTASYERSLSPIPPLISLPLPPFVS